MNKKLEEGAKYFSIISQTYNLHYNADVDAEVVSAKLLAMIPLSNMSANYPMKAPNKLVECICRKKAAMLGEANSIQQVSEILARSPVKWNGDGFEPVYPEAHVEEEELLNWLIQSKRTRLSHAEFKRCQMLFERIYPQDKKIIASGS